MSNIFWKALFWLTLLFTINEIYSAFTSPEILQTPIPTYLSIINVLIIPLWLYGLFVFAYSLKIIDLLSSHYLWITVVIVIAITTMLSLYYEFNNGGYTQHEMIMVSIITFLLFIPQGYALLRLTTNLKRNLNA